VNIVPVLVRPHQVRERVGGEHARCDRVHPAGEDLSRAAVNGLAGELGMGGRRKQGLVGLQELNFQSWADSL
jgi:hypothetical protein